jgi:hypothetical protein
VLVRCGERECVSRYLTGLVLKYLVVVFVECGADEWSLRSWCFVAGFYTSFVLFVSCVWYRAIYPCGVWRITAPFWPNSLLYL